MQQTTVISYRIQDKRITMVMQLVTSATMTTTMMVSLSYFFHNEAINFKPFNIRHNFTEIWVTVCKALDSIPCATMRLCQPTIKRKRVFGCGFGCLLVCLSACLFWVFFSIVPSGQNTNVIDNGRSCCLFDNQSMSQTNHNHVTNHNLNPKSNPYPISDDRVFLTLSRPLNYKKQTNKQTNKKQNKTKQKQKNYNCSMLVELWVQKKVSRTF